MIKVVKFGGTSLADGAAIRHAAEIIRRDPSRRYAVVSAPGKRSSDDIKVTDLLIRLYEEVQAQQDTEETLALIQSRFQAIVEELGIAFDMDQEIGKIRRQLKDHPGRDEILSRGEYLNARIIAAYLQWPFVDAGLLIRFDQNRRMDDQKTDRQTASILKDMEHAVIPGFYGCDAEGNTVTFSRGGSDVSGAVVARAIRADLYENWTDVSGIMSADPRIVDNPKRVEWISYRELREMSYMGATVLHEEAVFPVRDAGIPIRILNTMEPEAGGTMIVPVLPKEAEGHTVTGIAGKKGLSNIYIEKAMMNAEVGFGARVMNIIAHNGVPYEHTPTSIDTMSVIVETASLDSCRNQIITEIDRELKPDRIMIEDGIALAAVVGEGLRQNTGFAARLFAVLSEAGISVRMIDAGFSEMNVIIGVNAADYEKTVRTLYDGLYDLL